MKMMNARRSDRGFSLLEAMVALVIFSVVLLGLQAGLGTAISMNAENLLRQEAVNVAHERMERYRMNPGPPGVDDQVTRQIRNFNVTYDIDNDYDPDTGKVETTVTWQYKNKERELTLESYIGG